MPHEDPKTHFDKDLDAEVTINSILTDSILRFKLFAFLINLIMQAPTVQNESEINHLKFTLVVIMKFLL
jgi:hypothetical protein